jgi:hypothetical protein
VIYQLNEWRNDKRSSTLKGLDPEDQWPWKMTRWAIKKTHASTSFVHTRGLALSDSEKAKALADSPEAQFHPVIPVITGSY